MQATFRFLLVVAVAFLAPSAVGATQQLTFDRPAWVAYMTPKSVDYVAEFVEDNPTRKGRGHLFIYRSGSLQREQVTLSNGFVENGYADLSTGLSWQVTQNVDKKLLGLSASGSDQLHSVSLHKTPGIDHLLGETCHVWERVTPGRAGEAAPAEKDCITSDGILLWQKIFYGDGSVLQSAKAVSLKRRRVKPFEVTIPDVAITLSSYGQWLPDAMALPNDEVELQSSRPDKQGPMESIVIRRLGDTSIRDDRSQSRRTRLYTGHDYVLSVEETRSGKLNRLDLFPRRRDQELAKKQHAVSQSGKFETILGEQCQTIDQAPGAADLTSFACLTEDGLTLSESSFSWGQLSGGAAVRLVRGTLKPADMLPPSDILTGQWTGLGALPVVMAQAASHPLGAGPAISAPAASAAPSDSLVRERDTNKNLYDNLAREAGLFGLLALVASGVFLVWMKRKKS